MEKIASFKVDHLKLKPGLYVSRKDEKNNQVVTTFDLRITTPNKEPVMDMGAIHTIEHLGATYLRNCEYKDNIVYFGPMGCRTGFYLIVFDDVTSEDVIDYVLGMCEFILYFEGNIPGATSIECGNYIEQNLNMAKYYITKYSRQLKEFKRFEYEN